ncbi:N-6 DNA methylase [Candidatus Woesearchaeota archaeon]|nr:N-6 DNA methylase [Candidatus Woesearchaeota archaeon]
MASQKIPTKHEEREKLRNKGQFWTPNWVAKAMVSYVKKNSSKIFDPGTGSGAFLKALNEIDRSKNTNFYGIDIDIEVLKEDIYKEVNCHVEQRDFLKNPPNERFKAVVANPPYIRHHRIDKETKLFLKQLSKKKTGVIIDGRAGYHIYFLIQALSLLENKGRLAFIMPADTCEGTFAKRLWNWITRNFSLECVITFDEKATPFPSIDTNAVIFFIKKEMQKKEIKWVRVNKADTDDLYNFAESDFQDRSLNNLEITTRTLKEALETGLSRPQQLNNGFKYHLSDFANVMRGIATGANEFFFLTKEQVEELQIPKNFLKLAIGRTRDATGNLLSKEDIRELEDKGRPTYLLSINQQCENLPETLANYIKKGVKLDLPNRALIKQRKKWYYMERRETPALLFAYLGRRNSRFIKNEAGVVPLTGFLCVYPKRNDEKYINALWEILNHPETIENLKLVGKSYGSGAVKVEPRNLERLPLPDHLVEQYYLSRQQVVLNAFL